MDVVRTLPVDAPAATKYDYPNKSLSGRPSDVVIERGRSFKNCQNLAGPAAIGIHP